jgi:hypothetical protein
VFVIAGGLAELARLVVDSNLYARGQAVETLLSVTDCDTYDWFNTEENAVSNCLTYQLFSMGENDQFLSNLCDNQTESYPGGSFHALQIIAFWLSWMRARFSPDQRIRLHPHILRILDGWSVEDAGGDGSAPPEIEENERKLAKTLIDDFKREDALDVENPEGKGFSVGGIKKPAGFTIENNLVDSALASLFPNLDLTKVEIKSPEEFKDAGNKYYKENNFTRAFELYSLAQSALSASSGSELRSAVLFNLASVHWKFYKSCEDVILDMETKDEGLRGGGKPCVCGGYFAHPVAETGLDQSCIWEERRETHLQQAELLSDSVIALSGGHAKALYRKASCLLAGDRGKEAYTLLDAAVASLPKSAPAAEVEMLRGLMRHCIAAILAKSETISAGDFLSSAPGHGDLSALTAGQPEQGEGATEQDIITSELSCIRTGAGQPVLSKSTADMLRRLRMRDRHERLGEHGESNFDEADKDSARKAKGTQAMEQPSVPYRQSETEPLTLPSPPKKAAAGAKAKAVVKKPSAEDTAKAAKKKLQQKHHKALRSVLAKSNPAGLKTVMNIMSTVLYCTILYYTVLYCTILYYTVLYCTILYYTVLYCTILYCTILYYTVLYCTILYF